MRTFTKSPQTFTYSQTNNCTCKWTFSKLLLTFAVSLHLHRLVLSVSTFTKLLQIFIKSLRTFTQSQLSRRLVVELGTWTLAPSLRTFSKSLRTFTYVTVHEKIDHNVGIIYLFSARYVIYDA